MMKLPLTATLILSASAATAGGLIDQGLDDPHVAIPPSVETGWSGPYARLSLGRTEATTTYERERIEITETQVEVPVYDVCKDNGGHSGGEKCAGDRHNIDLTFGPDLPYHNGWQQTGLYNNNQNRVFLKGEEVTIVDAQGNVLGTGITDGSNPSGTLYRLNTDETVLVDGPDIIETFIDEMTDQSEDSTAGLSIGYRFDLTPALVGGLEVGSDGTLTTLEGHVGYAAGALLPYVFAGAGQYDDTSGKVWGAGVDLRVSERMFVGLKGTRGDFEDITTEGVSLSVGVSF
jgi:hypothetical protein